MTATESWSRRRFKRSVRIIGWIVMLCTAIALVQVTVTIVKAEASTRTTTWPTECQSHQNVWKASEGGITVGHLYVTATECFGLYGHLTSGTKISESYTRSTEGKAAGYKFEKYGSDVLTFGDKDTKDWNTYGRAQLCPPYPPVFGQVCGFDEQFYVGITIRSPYWMYALPFNYTKAQSENGVFWGEPLQRSANEKGYGLDWKDEGVPS